MLPEKFNPSAMHEINDSTRILLLHGIEDSTVPFTATSDAAFTLRTCGLVNCDEVYIEKCGHQDVVMQFMLGGAARDITMDYLVTYSKRKSKSGVLDHQRVEVRSRL